MNARDKHREDKSLARLLTQTSRAYRNRLGVRLAGVGLMAGQEQVLQALAAGPLSMSELGTVLNVRPPTVSKAVSRLSALGLLERSPNGTGDSRVVHVALTAAGKEKSGMVEAIWLATEAELLAGFGGKDEKRLRKLLRRATRNLAGPHTEPDAGQP